MRRYGNIIKLISAKTEYGRLAQLVEHLLDVQEVTGSSPVPSTMIPRPFGLGIFVVGGAGLAHGPACRSGRRASQFSRKKSNKKAVLPKQNCQVCDTG